MTLDAAETARVGAGGVHVAYRSTQDGIGGFTDGGAAAKSSNTYSLSLGLTAGSSYDVKVYYIDTDGKEVIVEWRRVTVPAERSLPGVSQQVTTSGQGQQRRQRPQDNTRI